VWVAADTWGLVELDTATPPAILGVHNVASSGGAYAAMNRVDAVMMDDVCEDENGTGSVQVFVGGITLSSLFDAGQLVNYGRLQYSGFLGEFDIPYTQTGSFAPGFFVYRKPNNTALSPAFVVADFFAAGGASTANNRGNFVARADLSGLRYIHLYTSAWGWGGQRSVPHYGSISTEPAVDTGFHWLKYDSCDYTEAPQLAYSGRGGAMLGLMRMLIDPNRVLAWDDFGHGSIFPDHVVDISNPSNIHYIAPYALGSPSSFSPQRTVDESVTNLTSPNARWMTGSGSSQAEWFATYSPGTGGGLRLTKVTMAGSPSVDRDLRDMTRIARDMDDETSRCRRAHQLVANPN
jgi:hypothetical protein